MANDCEYWLRIRGKKQNVSDFLHILNGEGPLVETMDTVWSGKDNKWIERKILMPDWSGRADIGEMEFVEADVKKADQDKIVTVEASGVCAWSVQSSLREGHHSIDALFEEFDISDMEIWSDEPGIGFREHYYYKQGEGLVVEDEHDYDTLLEGFYDAEGDEDADEDDDAAWERKREAIDEACPMTNEYVLFPERKKTKKFFGDNKEGMSPVLKKFLGEPTWAKII